MGSGLFEVSDCKVADTNRPDLSFSVEFLKRLHRLLERDLLPWIRPVDLVEVYLVDAEPFHASRGGSLKLIVSEIGPVDLGCHNKLVSIDVSQGSSHNLFAFALFLNPLPFPKDFRRFVASPYWPDGLVIISPPQVASLPDTYA